MAGKRIGLDAVKAGDVIDIVDIRRVAIREVTDHSVITVDGLVLDVDDHTRRESERRYNLISRPAPALPRDIGSIIKVNGVVWMLKEVDRGMVLWVPSKLNYVQSTTLTLSEYIRDSHNGEFEVIS